MTEHGNLRRLFDLAIAAPPAERGALLDRECGGDAGLRRRIEAMIAAAEDERFLGAPTADANAGGAPTVAAGPREGPGTRIGPYKILQLIGEGGFGSVFMAEQERPVARKVALKIIKLGMDTRAVIARFEAERQALAMMDHPNIARVLDAGATDLGRPYFVMDLVKGDPIEEYCDKNNLSIPDRLALFAQVCQAVQHAHTKGIIHRDIKPSNILVSTQDGRPAAKVIDFGIAKATASRLTEKTLFTEHRQLIGTPEYMSPEQAEGSLDIDTRTDVYSLGVLLYELLTGSTPFGTKELRSAAYAEMQRIIREVEPPKPSTRLSQSAETLASVAARRHTEPRKLGMIIRGELDWIVMKALEKDRSRRYETANALGADIGRYLSGEAVVAAPPGAAYRVRKFVKRHRATVVTGGVVVGVLVLGIVGTTVGLVAAQRERRVAVAARAGEMDQRKVAESRLAESEATVKFLDDMLGAADPLAQGKDVTVRTVLDRAGKSMGGMFTDRPRVAARLHGTIGRTYRGLGDYADAEGHMREAVAILRRELGPEDADTCRAVNELGGFLIKSGGHKEAEELLKKAAADEERLFGRGHEITVRALDQLATLYVSQMRSEDGEKLLREVLAARLVSPGKEHQDTLSVMNTLATLDADRGRFDEAERLFEEALEIEERLTGPEHPLTLQLRANLAWMQYQAAMAQRESDPESSARRMQRARTLGEQTLKVRARVLGEEHPDTLTTMNNLASVYKELKMWDEADALALKDIEVSVRVLGEEHPDTIVSLANYGNSLRSRQKYEQALEYLERSVRNARKSLPPGSQGMAFNLGWYGSCLRDLGRFEEAETPLLEARGIVRKAMGEASPVAHQMSIGLVMLYEAWDKAEPGKGHDAEAAVWRAKVEAGKPAQGNAAGKK